jgi:hypothetical protein
MTEFDKLMEKLDVFANTPLGAEIVAAAKTRDVADQSAAVPAASVAAKPADGVAQGDPGIEPSKDQRVDVDSPNNHADLKELAKKLRRPLDTLYALSVHQDLRRMQQTIRHRDSQTNRLRQFELRE